MAPGVLLDTDWVIDHFSGIAAITRRIGRERGRLRQRGTMIGDFDLLIAATALRHDLGLGTNNRRHFEMVEGLRILDVA